MIYLPLKIQITHTISGIDDTSALKCRDHHTISETECISASKDLDHHTISEIDDMSALKYLDHQVGVINRLYARVEGSCEALQQR